MRVHAAALLGAGLGREARLLGAHGHARGSLFSTIALVRKAEGEASALLVATLAAVRDVDRAAAKRVSEINADLPPVHWVTMTGLSAVLLGAFLIVDLGQPLGAALFAGVAGSAALFSVMLADVRDPFGGSWSVGAAGASVSVVLAGLADDSDDDGEVGPLSSR